MDKERGANYGQRNGNNKSKSLIFFLCIFCMMLPQSSAWASTYYVKNGGNDNYDGLSDSNAWATISKVNSAQLNPGDSVLFKRGSVWREQLVIQNSGTAGSPITIADYGTGAKPVFDGSLVRTGWTVYSGSTYQVAANPKAYVVVKNGVWQNPGSGKDTLTNGEWYWTNGILYYRSDAGNPDALGYVMESGWASGYTYNLFTYHASYITIQNISFKNTNSVAVFFDQTNPPPYQTGKYNSISDCDFTNIGETRSVSTGTIHSYDGDHLSILRNTFTNIYTDGVWSSASNADVENNTMTNVFSYPTDVTGEGTDGIQLVFGHNNTVSHNYVDMSNTNSEKGCILLTVSSTGTYQVDHNTCIGGRWGVFADVSNAIIEYNLLLNQKWSTDPYNDVASLRFTTAGGDTDRKNNITVRYNIISDTMRGIRLAHVYGVSDIKFYNNVFHNSTEEAIRIWGSVSGEFKNNIVWSNSIASGLPLIAYDNMAVISGQTWLQDYNIFGPESTSYLKDPNYHFYSTLAAWKAGTGYDVHSISANPQFVNPAGGDFHLQSSSPAIDAGINVGLARDFDGNPVPAGATPDIGALEYQSGSTPSDTTPPMISGVQATSITASYATITWTTDDLSDSQVDYGLTADYGYPVALDSFMVMSHSQTLSGLSSSTLYHYRVKSRNAAGNLSLSSDYTFTTTAPLADTTPPSVSITSPSPGATVSGIITVTATASDDVAIAGVQFIVDGSAIGAEDTSSPYSAQWNSSSVANGAHIITATARDVAGNYANASATITVSNPSLADTDQNGCIDMTELNSFINRWKVSIADVSIRELIEAIGLWKKGC